MKIRTATPWPTRQPMSWLDRIAVALNAIGAFTSLVVAGANA